MPKAFSVYERAAVKTTMLDIGAALIRKKGIRQVTVEDITKGANIAKGSFYSFYQSREELFWDIIKREENQLLETMKTAAMEHIDIKTKINEILYHLFLHENCLVFYLPQEDLQYISRKLPPELIHEDMESGQNTIKALLSICGLDEGQESVEIVMSMIHTLRFVASNDIRNTDMARDKMLGILVEAFTNFLIKEKRGKSYKKKD